MFVFKFQNDVFLFFFSSRRRHTRFDCDWSSDVCSSDLAAIGAVQTAQRLAPAVGPIVGGALAALVGLRAAFLVAASFYAVEIGRASCRERVEISGVAGSLKKKSTLSREERVIYVESVYS